MRRILVRRARSLNRKSRESSPRSLSGCVDDLNHPRNHPTIRTTQQQPPCDHVKAPIPKGTTLRIFTTILLLLSLATTAHAQNGGNPPPPLTPEQPGEDSVRVPRIERPLTLADFPNMAPIPALRDRLGHIRAMVQNSPQDGGPASERTELYLARTDTTFYAVFVCFDRQPATIRGHMARREQIANDDKVRLLLDPFQDHRRGILFQLNPLGIQADASWSGDNADFSYDVIWDGDGKRTAQGWIALMAIPFKSIRSPNTVGEWGVVASRVIPRLSETDFWPRISQQISGVLNQEATLLGMEGTRSTKVQLNPYGIAQRVKELNADNPASPYFSKRNLAGAIGGDIKAIVKDSIGLDGTINPDFSQVESDQPQFRVNQRFANFYPELRPFFPENSSYFDAPIQLLYTRTIQTPQFGARATGKIGRTNIGLLAIDDRAPGLFVASSDPLHGKRAYTTIARVSQDISRQSSIGLMYAQRTLGIGANRIGGLDFNAYLSPHWSLLGMSAVSSTRQQDGTYSAGPASRFLINRNGRSFGFNLQYRDFSQGYQADAGFITVPHVRQANSSLNYGWFPTHRAVQQIQLSTQNRVAFNRTGNRVLHYNENNLTFALPRASQFIAFAGQNSDTIGPNDYSQLTHLTNFTENYGGVRFGSSPINQVNFNLTLVQGATVNYNPAAATSTAAAAPPALLHQQQIKAFLTLQPISPLTLDNTYLLDRTYTASTGAFAYESQTLRTRINYQFTRAFGARAFVEYDSVLRNPLVSSLDRTKQVSAQILFSWLPHPGTALYIGYNSHLQNLDRTLCNRTSSGTCDPANTGNPRSTQYLNDGRNLFLKASYLLRF